MLYSYNYPALCIPIKLVMLYKNTYKSNFHNFFFQILNLKMVAFPLFY